MNMRIAWIKRFWLQALPEGDDGDLGWLASPRRHISLLMVKRTDIVIDRVTMLAWLFAVLMPLWSVLDAAVFPQAIWEPLLVARLLAATAFVTLVIAVKKLDRKKVLYEALLFLLLIPMAFYCYSFHLLSHYPATGLAAAVSLGYAFLPFVVVAIIAIFPLTLLESVSFIAPVLLLQVLTTMLQSEPPDWSSVAVMLWVLTLSAIISVIAGLSQLGFMIALVREAIRDGMTGCFSRSSGEELLDLQFILSSRNGTPLTLAFIDLDNFKQINDLFGHEAGDQVLVNAAAAIKSRLRLGDMLVRWGGEEFLVIMSNCHMGNAYAAVSRAREIGFGTRPDGLPVTASIGIAERTLEGAQTWRELVDIADERMYVAKRGGRDRVVASHDFQLKKIEAEPVVDERRLAVASR